MRSNTILPLLCLTLATLVSTGRALTVEESVTPAFLRAHPGKFTVKATEGDKGRIDFGVVHRLWEPAYLVAHLRVSHGGKIVAESDTPIHAGIGRHPLHFSVGREDLEASTFQLSESAVQDGQPLPGTKIYTFRLAAFIVDDEASPNAEAIAGSYYRGNGLSYNLELDLEAGGRYRARWHSCVTKPGEETGTWTLTGRRIKFAASKQDAVLKGHLRDVTVAAYDGDWILVPAGEKDRKAYDENGVTRESCFRKTDEDE